MVSVHGHGTLRRSVLPALSRLAGQVSAFNERSWNMQETKGSAKPVSWVLLSELVNERSKRMHLPGGWGGCWRACDGNHNIKRD